MLTEEERDEIIDEIQRHPTKQSACIEVLKIVQRHRGWVSDEIRDLAALLEMTPEEIDAVATFYSFIFRKPVGKHIILLCDSVCCWTLGYERMRDHLYARLNIRMGETSSDGQFTLLPISCIGACDVAPAMMVDDELIGNVTDEKIDEILKRYRE